MRENYLYFRADATLANDDDETAGSKMYPVSAFRGMVAGTATALGAVTDDVDAFSMFFTPMGHIAAGAPDASTASDGDHVDVIVVAIKTDNNQKAVMKSVIQAMNTSVHSTGFVEIFDAVTGYKVDNDIEGITVVHTVAVD